MYNYCINKRKGYIIVKLFSIFTKNNKRFDVEIEKEKSNILKDKNIYLIVKEDSKVKDLENKMIVSYKSLDIHPDEIIKKYQAAIGAYYELKDYCCSYGPEGERYFSEMWQHCHNSANPDFDFIDHLKEKYEMYVNNYEKHIDEYERVKAKSNPLEKEVSKHFAGPLYVNVDDRVNIYANSTNSYISTLGQKCIDFEEKLLEYAEYYKKSICPYCKHEIELPKQRKSCPHCKEKMYVVKGGIGQGMMVLKEEDKLKLSKLKKDFYEDRKYNENYGSGIVVDNTRILIDKK